MKQNIKCRYNIKWFLQKVTNWSQRLRKNFGAVSEYRQWWSFIWDLRKNTTVWVKDFVVGFHKFSPMIQYEQSRSCCRALDKVKALSEDAVHPADIQCYLSRWAAWWHTVVKIKATELLYARTQYSKSCEPSLVWLGRGLLINSPYDKINNINFTNLNQKIMV